MKFCRNCGNQLADNSQFCPNCGTPVATPVAQPNIAPEPVVQPYVAPQPIAQPYVAPEPITQPYVAPTDPYQQVPVQPQAYHDQTYANPNQAYANQTTIPPNNTDMNNMYPNGMSPAFAVPVKNANSKIGMIAFALIVVLIVFLSYILIFKNILGGTYKTPIKNYVSAIEDQDIKKLYKALPDYQVKEMKAEIADSYDGDASVLWDDLMGLGGLDITYTLDYTIDDKEKLDKDELEVIKEDIEYYYDEKVKVTAGYDLEIELIIGVYGIDQSETLSMTVVKMDGKWVIYDTGSLF